MYINIDIHIGSVNGGTFLSHIPESLFIPGSLVQFLKLNFQNDPMVLGFMCDESKANAMIKPFSPYANKQKNFHAFYNALCNILKKTEIPRTVKAHIPVIYKDPQLLLLVLWVWLLLLLWVFFVSVKWMKKIFFFNFTLILLTKPHIWIWIFFFFS